MEVLCELRGRIKWGMYMPAKYVQLKALGNRNARPDALVRSPGPVSYLIS